MAHPHRMASPPFRVEVFPTGLAAVVDRNGVNWGTGAGSVLFASKDEAHEWAHLHGLELEPRETSAEGS